MIELLALIGIGITLVGGWFAGQGQAQKNKADIARMQGQDPIYDAQQVALQAELDQIKADKKAAADLAAISNAQTTQQAALAVQTSEINKAQIAQEAALSVRQAEIQRQGVVVQGIGTAYQGAQAIGSVGARAGAGNLGGASVARQAQAIQTQTGRRIGLANAQIGVIGQQIGTIQSLATENIQKQDINILGIRSSAEATIASTNIKLASSLGAFDVQTAQTNAEMLASTTAETQNEADIQWLKDNGWMLEWAQYLGAGSQATNIAANTTWDWKW